MEVIGRKKGFDIWRTKDPEGRFHYGITKPLSNGTRVEPTQCPFYSPEAALEAALLVEEFRRNRRSTQTK